jgi:negative regulator of flagellin synthesis FlgM
MAINLTGLQPGGASIGATPKTSTSQPAQSAAENATSQPQGEVSITSTASLLSSLQQALSAQPAVDQNRVAALSKALADGTYTIQPDKIATGLLHSERSLEPLPRTEI